MMVAQRHNIAETIDTLERAVIMQQLGEVLSAISEGADEIAARKYWSGHQTITRAELILSEIAYKLHKLDMKDGGAP